MGYMDLGNFGKRTLLTGAGFSRNWGGYTAPEMMGQILRHLQDCDEARSFWVDVPSFEEGLARGRAGQVSPDALRHIERAVLEAFKSLDRQLQGSDGPWFPGVEKLLSQFYWRAPSGTKPDTGYLFTLNQDLLLERRFINASVHQARDPSLPGIRPNPKARYFTMAMSHSYDGIVASIESDSTGIALRKKFNYIKLHGSFNWLGESDGGLMVLGNRKADQIAALPLLGWYHEVFRKVLFTGNVRLMIIGYGFGDEHINKVIAEAIREHGLRIFIWDKQAGFEWVRSRPSGDDIASGLIGTESREMIEVFPRSQQETESYRSILTAVFKVNGA